MGGDDLSQNILRSIYIGALHENPSKLVTKPNSSLLGLGGEGLLV